VAAREAGIPYGVKPHAIYDSYPHGLSVGTDPPKSKPLPNSGAGRDGGAPLAPSNSGMALLGSCDH